jgi:LmbE family N-acetylglucosaminyl deacetylase
MKTKILIVAAHPDDEILGCAGTVARSISEGDEVYTLILGEGITSRDDKRQREKRESEIKELKACAYKANKTIGVKDVYIYDLPDNRFDTVPLLDVVKLIDKTKNQIKPHIVYTHHHGDLNIDHRITYRAVLTACRPIGNETVREIYSFEIPSSTDWNYPNIFKPNFFVNVAKTIDKKIKALRFYGGELREFPHPRSEESIKIAARRWGSISNLEYAEAFEIIRAIK